MAIETLPIALDNPVVLNVSPVSPYYAEARDIITGIDKGIYKRPGLQAWVTLPTSSPIDGLFWWESKKMLIAVSNKKVYKLTSSLGNWAEITPAGAYAPEKYVPVIFAIGYSSSYQLTFCNGNGIYYTDGGTTYTKLADGDAPTDSTHIAYFDLYLLANKASTDQFVYSDVADFTTWIPLDTAVASYDPDNVIAVHTGDREILFVGEHSIESWYDDGVTPFSRNDAACIESGCIAAYSFTRVNNDWFWLDEKRQVVKRAGRVAQPVMAAYDPIIRSFTTVSDAKGSAVHLNGMWYYVLSFPTEGRTFVYNASLDKWESEWCFWNTGTASYENTLMNNFMYCPAWNIQAVGSREGTGIIYKLIQEEQSDAGEIIRSLKQTANLDFGSTAKVKWGYDLIVTIRRGSSLAEASPELSVRWKNDNRDWSDFKVIPLGDVGDYNSVIRIRAPGRFRKRQYEFVMTDKAAFEIISAEQLVDI